MYLPFTDFAPDLPALSEGSSLIKNVLPAKESFRSFPSLSAYSDALTAFCRGAVAVKDADLNTYNFAGDASTLYKLTAGSYTSATQSVTGTDISFTATSGIASIGTDLSVFNDGETITVSGSGSNDGTYIISGTPTSTSITTDEISVVNESAGASVTITRVFTCGDNSFWAFEKWGEKVIATNYDDDPQIITLGSNYFERMAATAPKARCVGVVRDFVVLGFIDNGSAVVPNRVQWSGIDDETDWSSNPATQADYQDLQGKGGAVKAIASGEVGYVFQDQSIWRMTYIGPPAVFQFDEVETQRGTLAGRSVIRIGSFAYYLGRDGFYVFDGVRSTPISTGTVNKYFWDDYDQDYPHRVHAAFDPQNQIIIWAYPGAGNTSGRPNKLLVYNWAYQRWAVIEQEVEYVFNSFAEGITMDELDAYYASVDAVPESLDSSIWQGGAILLSGFDSSHIMGNFSGTALAAVVRTSESPLANPMIAFVNMVRPITDATCTLKVGTRMNQNDSITWSSSYTVESYDQSFSVRETGRYVTFELTTSGDFSHLQGVYATFTPVGGR